MWEAFLVQMNDFDRYLEIELAQLLDPVVARRPPTRRGRPRPSREPVLLPLVVGEGLAAEAIPVSDPVVVTLPVASARPL